MKSLALLNILCTATLVLSQLTCPTGLFPGSDTVIFTVPYTYTQVLSIVGSYRNITWSGSPYDSVVLNGTDNTVGTSRTYDLVGAHVVETLIYYSKPANGPYVEYHDVAFLTVPSANVSFSSPFDFTQVDSVCGGLASTFNFTILFCATNVTIAGPLLHSIHLGDGMTVGVFLGGQNFTTCAALASTTSGSNSSSTATPTKTTSPAVFTGTAALWHGALTESILVAGLTFFVALIL